MGNKVTKSKYLSKKTGKEIDVVDPDFDIFFEKFGKKIEKEDSNTDTVFQEAVDTMGILLCNHPFFVREVKRIREVFQLSENGIISSQHALWLSESEQRSKDFSETVRVLASKFWIPPEIKNGTVNFIQDHVLFNKKEFRSRYKTELRLVTKEQIEADPDASEKVYLPISATTSIREVKKYLGKLQKAQEKKVTKRYGVPNIDPFGETVWKKFQDGLTAEEVKEDLKGDYRKIKGGTLMAGDVRRIRDRFKKALNKIRPIK